MILKSESSQASYVDIVAKMYGKWGWVSRYQRFYSEKQMI